jgi:hypothetical protein
MKHRLLITVILVGIAAVSLAVEYELHFGGKAAVALQRANVFSSEFAAAYEGALNRAPIAPITSIDSGEQVTVLRDTYGKDYWACYVRTSTGQRGWVLCGSIRMGGEDPCFLAYWNKAKTEEFASCEASAKAGDPNSEFGYGLILFSGHDRANDRSSGLDWFRKSARQGYPLARGFLCSVLPRDQIGKSLTNPEEAYAWCSISGSPKRASEIKAGMTDLEAENAEKLASEYLSKFGPNRALDHRT